MNFNDLHADWAKQGTDIPGISPVFSRLKAAHQPIDAIRKNMKWEFYVQVFAIISTGFFPLFFDFNEHLRIGYFILYALLATISLYYFLFFKFFKKMDNYSSNAKDNLYELYYEARLHIEMYKSFTFLITPFVMVLLGMIFYTGKLNLLPNTGIFKEFDLILLPLLAVLFIGCVIIITHLWVNSFYGRHIAKIREILYELSE